jgi:hypothetical protein
VTEAKLQINGNQYDADQDASSVVDDGDIAPHLNPGITADRLVVFDVPPGLGNGVLVVHASDNSSGAKINLG